MTIRISYTQARANLDTLLKRVTDDREVVVIQRRGQDDVVMVSATDFESLLETAYLLRSPKNAERLFGALERALKKDGASKTLDELRREVNLE